MAAIPVTQPPDPAVRSAFIKAATWHGELTEAEELYVRLSMQNLLTLKRKKTFLNGHLN
ncbi:MAG TPA: hypothetical protein VK541_18710 [Pedobacter sp.]|uniref:hypothetical protein n=1 Tax=Pedobacter sp. TaxID=1411316 RepID=UPI002CB9C439|nr:hypothetical protein [Pedobacter sp.]HMI04529.1 hypothetical protein [Pedobacter sp.]